MNVLEFICNCAQNPNLVTASNFIGNNRANNAGDALESFVKDGFSDSFSVSSESERVEKYSEVFSFLGNKNNPPDLMLKNSDAIEIKKLESKSSAIALNSSYPKNKLYSDSRLITGACRTCEDWSEKDLLYVIGHVNNNQIKTLWLIYGDCYAADKFIYERIKNKIELGIKEIHDVEFTETNEIGKVKRVDPLGITDLRIRGMWHIENPIKVYNYLEAFSNDAQFQLICIMRREKYDSFSEQSREKVAQNHEIGIYTTNVRIKNPDNPADLLDAVQIIFRR